MAASPVVLDTNIVLDLFVFADPAAVLLLQQIEGGSLQWIATAPMRDELARVLDYPAIAARRTLRQTSAHAVLQWFDRLAQPAAVAPKAVVTCKDPDDQKFIDLAVAHRAVLLSKDQAVLCMRKRLLALGVVVSPTCG
jgi:predicted nucleic acid-binding protein